MFRHSSRLAIIALLLLAAGCGGSQPSIAPPSKPIVETPGNSSAGQPVGSVLRSASGAPIGVRLTWVKLPVGLLGYHIYFSDETIPDSARGDTEMMLEVGGSKLIAQPGGSAPILVDHIFPVSVGETYFYRLSSVWQDEELEEESQLGGELQVDITPFTVASIENPNVGVGTTMFIQGQNFGEPDASDTVEFTGVTWVPGTGFQPAMLPAEIISWTPTRIGAKVPLGATTGTIDVTIGGLTASTLNTFTNSQPYITSISPLAADITEAVTITGNNFGNAQNGQHFAKFALFEVTDPDLYESYTNTEIVFHPLNLRQYETKELRVGAAGFLSNIGFLDLENAPPVPFLIGAPASGPAPLNVKFEPVSGNGVDVSFDPEGAGLTFDYDFTDDGSIDATRTDFAIVPGDYIVPGQFTCRLTVTDADGGSADTTMQVNVGPPVLQLADAGADAGGKYYESDDNIQVRYLLSGGQPPFDVDWVLVNTATMAETVIATDVDVSAGANAHIFDLDTLSTTPVADSNLIPLGDWQIRADASDGTALNDPDNPHTWPEGGGSYSVQRYRVAIINDAVGDPGGTQRDAILLDLQANGYEVSQFNATNVQISDLAGIDAAIWPGQFVSGQAQPYEWLSVAELGLMQTFIDAGGVFILLAPPCTDSSSGAFPQAQVFSDAYQPFIAISALQDQAGSPDAHSFTAVWDHTVTRPTITNGDIGRNSPGTSLHPGSVLQVGAVGPNFLLSAYRPGAMGAGGLYLGMIQYSSISLGQPGETRPHFLDNIVAGSIGQ